MIFHEVAPHDGGCWYCHKADENLVFSIEWDAYVHPACVREALGRDPQDAEALVFARELGIETAGVGGDDEGRPGTDLRALIADLSLTTEQQRRLQHLRRLTNDALDAAKAAGIEDAVNWGNLSCVEAALVLTDEGHSYYRVIIEEASPDAYHLRVYVRNWLAKHGWTDVEVLTEW